MKPNVERSYIEQNLKKVILDAKNNAKLMKEIRDKFKKHEIGAGEIGKIFIGKTPLNELELVELCLLCIILYDTGKVHGLQDIDRINPENFFTPTEIKEAQMHERIKEDNIIELPIVLENVNKFSDNDYSTQIDAQMIKKLVDSKLLDYNFEFQREARYIKSRQDPNTMIPVPKLYKKNVKEMVELAEQGKLASTTLTFNALLGSSDEGEELIYDEKNRTLTITEGTKLYCLDGWHRITAIVTVLNKHPELNMLFRLDIKNFSKNEAIEHFRQINKAMPIATSRQKEVDITKHSNLIIRQLRVNSELGDKIAATDHIAPSQSFITTYSVMADAIEDIFDISGRPEAMELAKYLSEFFNTLILNNYEAFVTNVPEIRSKSLINTSQMMWGYLMLAKRMREEKIPLSELNKIISRIDFSRNNPLWQEIGLINKQGHVTTNPSEKIKKFFEQLDLKGGELAHV